MIHLKNIAFQNLEGLIPIPTFDAGMAGNKKNIDWLFE